MSDDVREDKRSTEAIKLSTGGQAEGGVNVRP